MLDQIVVAVHPEARYLDQKTIVRLL